MTSEEIAANRAVALYHLRTNPKNRTKIRAYFTDDCNGRCSVGLLCDAFGIPIANTAGARDKEELHASFRICANAYDALAKKLDLNDQNLNRIWGRNDASDEVTYEDVANYIENNLFL